jgi:hypothetical protein
MVIFNSFTLQSFIGCRAVAVELSGNVFEGLVLANGLCPAGERREKLFFLTELQPTPSTFS